MTRPRTQAAPEKPKRTSVSELAKLMAERRVSATPSVSIKMGAGGLVVPDVTVTPDCDDAVLDRMVTQALGAFTRILREATAEPEGKGGRQS